MMLSSHLLKKNKINVPSLCKVHLNNSKSKKFSILTYSQPLGRTTSWYVSIHLLRIRKRPFYSENCMDCIVLTIKCISFKRFRLKYICANYLL